jgi:hypothetical protein
MCRESEHPGVTTTRRAGAVAATAAFLALALSPASAGADVFRFGSTLAASANLAEAHQADTVFWSSAFPDGRSLVAPADGQIRLVKLKGIALSDTTTGAGPVGGERDFHVQVMQPLANGTFQIRNSGGTSGNLVLPPGTADPQTITDYHPENLCVRKGDVVAFNTVGGWDGVMNQTGPYPGGTPLQIFSAVPGSVTSEYEHADGTNNGDVVTAAAAANRELLMQMTLGVGAHATALCPGGTAGAEGPLALDATAPPPPEPVSVAPAPAYVQMATLPARQRVTVSRKGKLSVSLFCRLSTSRCKGTVQVRTRTSRRTLLGSQKFDIAGKSSGRATIQLSATGRRLFRRGRGRLPVRIVAVTSRGGSASLTTTLRRR